MTSTLFWRVRTEKVWRRLWKGIFSRHARFSTLWSLCRTLSGEIGPPVGNGKMYSVIGIASLLCYAFLEGFANYFDLHVFFSLLTIFPNRRLRS